MIESIKLWIEEHVPTWCSKCRGVWFYKDMVHAYLTTGKRVFLCKKCHDVIFSYQYYKENE